MNQPINTTEQQNTIPYGYALKMILGWSILYMGSLVAFIQLIYRNTI
ncbi:hypothetical protein [Acinetobacter sp. 2JN-4]|nr:hypothetical protein [Acinetobacter sp. 2JN-4]